MMQQGIVEMPTSIVFYCKFCKGIMFACVNNEHLSENAGDIAECIKVGHRMAEVSLEEVRCAQWCSCHDKVEVVDVEEQLPLIG
jgi:hypothetical protein